jgi:hypothetical protein
MYMYLQKVIGKEKFDLFFVGIMSATDEKSMIRIRKSVVRIRGSRSVPKCHGSATLTTWREETITVR